MLCFIILVCEVSMEKDTKHPDEGKGLSAWFLHTHDAVMIRCIYMFLYTLK